MEQPFVMERHFNAPVEKLWRAFTDTERMKQWYFDTKGFKPEVGAEFSFTGENEGRVFVHLCKVTQVIPNDTLSYSWRYEGYEGNSQLTFQLFKEADGTRLKLTHEGLETFPPTNDFKGENFKAGWDYIIGTSLPNFLTQHPA